MVGDLEFLLAAGVLIDVTDLDDLAALVDEEAERLRGVLEAAGVL